MYFYKLYNFFKKITLGKVKYFCKSLLILRTVHVEKINKCGFSQVPAVPIRNLLHHLISSERKEEPELCLPKIMKPILLSVFGWILLLNVVHHFWRRGRNDNRICCCFVVSVVHLPQIMYLYCFLSLFVRYVGRFALGYLCCR